MATATPTTTVHNCTASSYLPGVTAVIGLADPSDRADFNSATSSVIIKEEPMQLDRDNDEDLVANIELGGASSSSSSVSGAPSFKRESLEPAGATGGRTLNQLIARQYKFLESVSETKTIHFLTAMSQLAHMDTGLAENIWLNFFPRAWTILSEFCLTCFIF